MPFPVRGADIGAVKDSGVRDTLHPVYQRLKQLEGQKVGDLSGLTEDNFRQYPRTVAALPNGGAGDTVGNTNVTTAFATVYSLGNGDLSDTTGIGRRGMRVRAGGIITYQDVVTDTLKLRLMLGTTILLDSGARTFPALFATKGWRFEADIVIVSTGAGGSVEAAGHAQIFTNLIDFPNSAAVSVDVGSAADLAIDVTWSVSNANDTITLRTFVVEALSVP